MTHDVSNKLTACLESARKDFIRKFGREPGPDDPILFDPDADIPQPMDEAKLRRDMIAAFKQAGTPGHLIYAFDRAGLILTEQTYATAPDDVRADWDMAIGEWEKMSRAERRRYIREVK